MSKHWLEGYTPGATLALDPGESIELVGPNLPTSINFVGDPDALIREIVRSDETAVNTFRHGHKWRARVKPGDAVPFTINGEGPFGVIVVDSVATYPLHIALQEHAECNHAVWSSRRLTTRTLIDDLRAIEGYSLDVAEPYTVIYFRGHRFPGPGGDVNMREVDDESKAHPPGVSA